MHKYLECSAIVVRDTASSFFQWQLKLALLLSFFSFIDFCILHHICQFIVSCIFTEPL